MKKEDYLKFQKEFDEWESKAFGFFEHFYKPAFLRGDCYFDGVEFGEKRIEISWTDFSGTTESVFITPEDFFDDCHTTIKKIRDKREEERVEAEQERLEIIAEQELELLAALKTKYPNS